jgi:LuxR family maltose regulon positive regulatory protein
VVPLLRTKLYIPRVRAELVRRARLIERLDAGLGLGGVPDPNPGFRRKLTLVSAPAGFGKTTLLSEWVSSRGEVISPSSKGDAISPPEGGMTPPLHVAWVSLDEGDNDPARFLAYVIAALQGTGVEQSTGGRVGKGLSDMLQSPQRLPVEELLTALINQIGTISERLVLILDDYHAIHTQRVHDALAFLLEHLPPQMHVMIATRADPPLPLARLRGQGQLTELRQADLRFTVDEAAQFLNRVMGLGLSVEDIATLSSRTEGWIAALHLAALQIAALSTRGDTQGDDAGALIQAFTGSDRYILDYLMEEVLRCQPEAVQSFLLHTAVLRRLVAPLCDAVLGRTVEASALASSDALEDGVLSPSQEVLEALERANLFVVPLDNERRWYRYHHLFADLLRQRLRQVRPGIVPTLHGRASAWHEQNGFTEEAIHHALLAGDADRAAGLIEREAETKVMHSELNTVQGWVEGLPDEIVKTRPLLCILHSWALLVSGCPLEAAEARLQDAVQADEGGSFSGEILTVHALIAAYQMKTRESVELSSRALELLPEQSTFFRSFVAGYLGLNYLYTGDLVAARGYFEQAVQIGQRVGNLMNVVLALCHLAEISAIEGRITEARATYEKALALAVNGDRRRLPIAGIPLIGLGRILLLRNQLDEAARHLLDGIELIFKWGEAGALGGYIGLAYLKHVQGDVAGARSAIEQAEQLAARFDAMRIDDDYVAANKASLSVLQGDLDAAARLIEGQGLENGFCSSGDSKDGVATVLLARAYACIAFAHLRIAQGRPGEALAILRPLCREMEDAGWGTFALRILVLEALAFQAQGDVPRALGALERAFAIAEPERCVHFFLCGGQPMAQLLYQAAAQGIAPEFAGQILAAFQSPGLELMPEEESGSKLETLKPGALIEPLSKRELEVLALIAEGLTNREIAQKLHLALSTIKVHTYNTYGKLDVHSRIQAVARARLLGLLPFV